MCAMVSLDEFCDDFLNWFDADLSVKYQNGISQNVVLFIKQRYPSALDSIENPTTVDTKLLGKNFANVYMKKYPQDLSAWDLACKALNHVGLPPEGMSVESLEKKIREVLDCPEYINQTYIKRVQGGANVFCLNCALELEITSHEDVVKLIRKQIAKAEKKHGDDVRTGESDTYSPEWRKYELEKAMIKYEDERAEDSNELTGNANQTKTDELYYMVKALFSLFFTDFDFASLETDMSECSALDEAKDFGERYQYLNDLLNSPNFNWKYYSIKTGDVLLEKVAEKIAEKVIERMNEK